MSAAIIAALPTPPLAKPLSTEKACPEPVERGVNREPGGRMPLMEREPGIHQLTIGKEPFAGFPPPNAFLVCGAEASVLIDAGWEGEADHEARLAALRDADAPPLMMVLLTHRHPDHAGGALRLHRATGAPLGCHSLDREVIERDRLAGGAQVAELLHGGERLDLGGLTLEVLHAPGHTLGCLAVFIPEPGALFTTDTVMGVSTTVVRPGEGDLAQYGQTLEMLRGVGATTLYPGHGGPIADPGARLRALIDHRRRREEELLETLSHGPRTVTQLREVIYHDLPPVRHQLAEAQLQSGLEKLIAEGKARADQDSYTVA